MGTCTYTETVSFARFSLLKMQILNALANAAYATEDDRKKVAAGLDKHYIEQVTIMGLYQNGNIGAELRIAIDWRLHKISVQAGGAHIQVPGNWVNGIAPSLDDAIALFNNVCNGANFSRIPNCSPTSWIQRYMV